MTWRTLSGGHDRWQAEIAELWVCSRRRRCEVRERCGSRWGWIRIWLGSWSSLLEFPSPFNKNYNRSLKIIQIYTITILLLSCLEPPSKTHQFAQLLHSNLLIFSWLLQLILVAIPLVLYRVLTQLYQIISWQVSFYLNWFELFHWKITSICRWWFSFFSLREVAYFFWS